jgi:D-proline reductase (dithiol) PrdB
MYIVEEFEKWTSDFQQGWMKWIKQSKLANWKLYRYVKNEVSPPSKGLDLSKAKLLLISSAGAYLPAKDKPFDASNILGDYSIRTFPMTTPFSELEYAHEHYDQSAVREDAQVLLPLKHLQFLVEEKAVGSLSDVVISFMGYQPRVNKVVKKMIPEIVALVKREQIDAVLLVPS